MLIDAEFIAVLTVFWCFSMRAVGQFFIFANLIKVSTMPEVALPQYLSPMVCWHMCFWLSGRASDAIR